MGTYDYGYKRLFSHPRMVQDLLQGFVHEGWVAELDLSTLERVNGSYISDDLRERENDLVWRVRRGGRWAYVYLLLEFQSTVDRYMAVRLLAYIALLYQDLIKAGQLEDGLLPPVFPLVLYNGERCWNAPLELTALRAPMPEGLAAYQPMLRYMLLDEGRFRTEELPGRNLVAAVIRAENSREPPGLREVVQELIDWLRAPAQEGLRRAFAGWLGQVLLPNRLRGLEFPELNELHEVDAMLAERVKEWTRQWREEGIQEGMQKGIQKGMQKGREEGREEGEQQGMQKGEALLLERLLTRRFGPLPEWARTRIASAGCPQLDRWAERLLEAASLGEVFGE